MMSVSGVAGGTGEVKGQERVGRLESVQPR